MPAVASPPTVAPSAPVAPAAQQAWPCITWPTWRFAQREDRSRWFVAPAIPDTELSKVGYKLGGPYRDALDLSREEQVELASLIVLGGKAQTPEQSKREAALLGRCPFSGPMPPLDLDITADADAELVATYALVLTKHFVQGGLGKPAWFRTGGKGFHGDLVAPNGLRSIFLLRAMGDEILNACASEVEPGTYDLDLLSHHRLKEGRPSVVLDDTLYARDAEARGVMWRLAGSLRDDTGRRKLPTDACYIENDQEEPDWDPGWDENPSHWRGKPGRNTAVSAAISRYVLGLRKAEEWHITDDQASQACLRSDNVFLYAERKKALDRIAQEKLGGALLDGSATPLVPGEKLPEVKLRRLFDALVAADPGKGGRHTLRLAVAGWLLRRKISPVSVELVLGALGDTDDAVLAVATTTARIASDESVRSFGWIHRTLGLDKARSLEDALADDLVGSGAQTWRRLSDRLTEDDREVLRSAARVAGEKWQAKLSALPEGHALRVKVTAEGGPHGTALRRASRCGFLKQRGHCKGCDLVATSERWLASESILCPHCAFARTQAFSQFVLARWYGDFAVAVTRCPDDTLATCRKVKNELVENLPPEMKTNIRWVMSPGYVLCITADQATSVAMSSYAPWSHVTLVPIEKAVQIMAPAMGARASRLRRMIQNRDLDGLATDGWVTRVVETSGGKKAREEMPWPTKKDYRACALEAQRAREEKSPLTPEELLRELVLAKEPLESKCCGLPVLWKLLSRDGLQVIATRTARPFNFLEATDLAHSYSQNPQTMNCDEPLWAITPPEELARTFDPEPAPPD